MVANEEILRLNQAAFEAIRGTDVAADRKVYANISPNFTKAIREFTDTSGSYDDRRRVAFQREIVTFSGVDLLTYDDLAWWAQLMLKGNVAGVGDAGTPEMFEYEFVPTSNVDDLESMTLEWNHVGNAYQSTQVMVNSWNIRIDPDNEGGWLLDTEMLARDMTSTTHTAGPTDRTTEVIFAPGTELYLDDSFAGLGTTLVSGKFISATISGNNNIHFKAFSENATSYAANKVGRGPRRFDATIVMEFDSDAEFAKMRAGTKRYARFSQEGSVIHTAVTHLAQIDMAGYWSTISWGNREGNIIATFGLAGFFDAGLSGALNMRVQNTVEDVTDV